MASRGHLPEPEPQPQPHARPSSGPTHRSSPPLVVCWPSAVCLDAGYREQGPRRAQADVQLGSNSHTSASHGGTGGTDRRCKNNARKGGGYGPLLQHLYGILGSLDRICPLWPVAKGPIFSCM